MIANEKNVYKIVDIEKYHNFTKNRISNIYDELIQYTYTPGQMAVKNWKKNSIEIEDKNC